ncbi:MAG: hypothetical protein OEY78_02355 [Gammaproteobacteria bacterium]|nr:hypothetical protein [Gammaproteobacteria bacterium]
MFTTILKILGFLILALIIIATIGVIWLDKSGDACWNQEAEDAINKYRSLTSRADILRLAAVEKDPATNPVKVIEKDPNGCSLGGNGQTIIKFYFNNDNKLVRLEVYRHYIGSDQQMLLIQKANY